MKRVYSVFSFLLIVALVCGQYDPKENFYDAEFFFAEEDYAEALYAFNQVYQDGYQENANINYRIGVCLLNLDNRKTEAIPFLEKATKSITVKYKEGSFKEVNAPIDAYLYLGNAYRIDNNFDEAIKSYNTFLEKNTNQGIQSTYVKLQIEACERGKKLDKSKTVCKVATIGQLNEVRAPVYNPAISGDMGTFAFMGRQKFYNGVYVSRKQDGKWTKPYNITPSIQSDGNQTVLSLSNDGKQILLSWADQFESDIWITEYKDNRWYTSKPLGKPVNSKYYESHACFTPDGNTIYFTSNRQESLGQMDIFKVNKKSDGTWGELILLGENINTTLNEENPFVSPDGKRLYFSSQGHSGYGGFDIFYCDILADGSFSKPVGLDYPLNTTDDDFAFSPDGIKYDNYLTFYAKGTDKDVEIYRYQWIPEDAQPVQLSYETDNCIEAEKTEDLAVIEEPAISEETQEPVEELAEEIVPEEVEVAAPVVVEESYKLRPIFFDFDSYSFTASADAKLKEIIKVMTLFPSIKLEITGHTDAVGTDTYNIMLSEKRANAVAKYLKDNGIAESRLMVTGKGEKEPIALNRTLENRDSPKGRALNRRVHFNVSVPGGVPIEVDQVNVPENLQIK